MSCVWPLEPPPFRVLGPAFPAVSCVWSPGPAFPIVSCVWSPGPAFPTVSCVWPPEPPPFRVPWPAVVPCHSPNPGASLGLPRRVCGATGRLLSAGPLQSHGSTQLCALRPLVLMFSLNLKNKKIYRFTEKIATTGDALQVLVSSHHCSPKF